MKPVPFKQVNHSFENSNKESKNSCLSLPVYSNGRECISCWKMSFYQRILILFTGKIYLGVVANNTHPPVFLNAINPVTLSCLQKWKKRWKISMITLRDYFQCTYDYWKNIFLK